MCHHILGGHKSLIVHWIAMKFAPLKSSLKTPFSICPMGIFLFQPQLKHFPSIDQQPFVRFSKFFHHKIFHQKLHRTGGKRHSLDGVSLPFCHLEISNLTQVAHFDHEGVILASFQGRIPVLRLKKPPDRP